MYTVFSAPYIHWSSSNNNIKYNTMPLKASARSTDTIESFGLQYLRVCYSDLGVNKSEHPAEGKTDRAAFVTEPSIYEFYFRFGKGVRESPRYFFCRPCVGWYPESDINKLFSLCADRLQARERSILWGKWRRREPSLVKGRRWLYSRLSLASSPSIGDTQFDVIQLFVMMLTQRLCWWRRVFDHLRWILCVLGEQYATRGAAVNNIL